MARSGSDSGGATAPAFTSRDWHDAYEAGSPHHHLALARRTKANLLLAGAEWAVASFVRDLSPVFVEPVVVRERLAPLSLPRPGQPCGTLVIHGVESLTRGEQRALHQWLATRNGSTRVVSTASGSLLSMFESALFDVDLYYRLNTIRLDLLDS